MLTITLIAVYLVGFLITLVLLHKFKKQMGLDNYDPPHPEYYDDWSSNAQAFAWFSAEWPIFWFFQIAFWIAGAITMLSLRIGELVTKKSNKDASN